MAQHDVYAPFKYHSISKTGSKGIKDPKQRPYDPFPSPHNPVRGEQGVWIAVITQAMMDALSRSNQAEMRYHREEAIRWLTGGSKDFITVCLLAGFDPDYVRMRAKRSLITPTPWRAEAGKGKRYAQRKAYREKLKTQKQSISIIAREQAVLVTA